MRVMKTDSRQPRMFGESVSMFCQRSLVAVSGGLPLFRATAICVIMVAFLAGGDSLVGMKLSNLSWAQEEKAETQADASSIRVRGQLSVPDPSFQVDLSGFEMTLEEIVPAPQPPLPPNFEALTLEERRKWYSEFLQSKEGQAFQAKVAEIDAARKRLSCVAGEDGKFVFEEGFPATFGLYGQKEFKRDGKTFLADFFAEVPVGEGIKFLDLGTLPLSIRRVLQTGELAPDLVLGPEGSSIDPQSVPLKKYAGRPLLLFFWTRDGLESIETQLQSVVQQKPGNVQLLGVCLDAPDAATKKYLADTKQPWAVLSTAGMENSQVMIDYGVLAVPAFCLLDAKGQVLLNDEGFYEALSQPEATMPEVIKAALSSASGK